MFDRLIKIPPILLLTIISFIFSASTTLAQTIRFSDNFNDGSANDWIVIGNPTNWGVVNEEYGILVNSGVTNTVPSDELWNFLWKDFLYEVDLRGVQGTDKNILIKFKDTQNFYEIHHTGGLIHFEKVVNGIQYEIASPINYPLENGIIYHFKIEVQDNHYKIDESGNLLFDMLDPEPTFEGGKIGLRVGTGAVAPSEVWYDNIKVSSLNSTIGPFDLPIEYEGRPNSTPEQFKKSFWKRLTAAFDHLFKEDKFQPFTGDKYKPEDCPSGSVGIKCYDSHNGTDFSKNPNKKVLSVANGNVIFASEHTSKTCTPNKGGFGCVVIVEYPNNLFGLYAHLEKIYVTEGDPVDVNTEIAKMGNTGCPTCGKHLHFGVIKPESLSTQAVKSLMTKTDWKGLLFEIKQTTTPRFKPFCTYKAPNGQKFFFQDPSGWKESDKDPWSKSKDKGGCGIISPYLWKFDVGTFP